MKGSSIAEVSLNDLTVVIVSNTATPSGGASTVAINSALALSACGHKVLFFAGGGPVCDTLENSNVGVVCLEQKPYLESGGGKGGLQGLWDRRAAWAFRLLLDGLDPASTIVHFHSWQHVVSASPIWVAIDMGFPIVITAHEYSLACPNMALFDYQAKANCEKKAMSFDCLKCNCDKRSYLHKLYRFARESILMQVLSKASLNVIYISKRSRAILEERKTAKISARRSFYLPDPVSAIQHSAPGYNERGDYVVFVGRLSPEKDPKTFCEGVRIAGVRGVVVGDGDLRTELEAAYPNVEFVGWKSHEEALNYIAGSRGLVFPSICFETAGLSVLEANMASETPCIVSKNSVTAEYVVDGSGLLFETGDPVDLARKIKELMDPDTFGKLQEIIRAKDFSEFDETEHITTLLAIYREIVAGQRGTA